ncbi:tumor necrosis factor receptor superfamily member 6B-like [Cololabis saira]|uniref:tumor necrosis factor receptor superfamily member 6B-like n=1 Tax=Cololabis saira TaxID=129043 RepID=UPI002AD2C656|nr:tumor necrosis factor receptor superfamily member 6B-like [Cololabis saira]
MDPAGERLTLLDFLENMPWAEEGEYGDPFLGTRLALGDGPGSPPSQSLFPRRSRPSLFPRRPYSAGLQQLLRTCSQYGSEYNIKYNTKKTNVMIVRSRGDRKLAFPDFFLADSVLTECDEVHLPQVDGFACVFFSSLLQLCLLALLSLRAAPAGGAAPLSYETQDPGTGEPLLCAGCPPGTFLRAPCTARTPSECAPCPAGSFTELWNYMGRCLRCGVCGHQQVLKKACTADSDCQCECRQGFYYHPQHDMCVTHSECPTGQGVLRKGTAEKDTECHICSDGTYSNISSAQHGCAEHKSCSNAGLQTVLRGSSWHDSVCANCGELKDGADYLKEIIPAFFVRYKISRKRLRRMVHRLLTEGGKQTGGRSQLASSAWVSSATATQIRQLPAILARRRGKAGKILQKMLSSIEEALTQMCSLRS